MKSFPITKEMRADIAQRLTAKAVAAEVDAIDKDAKRINKEFWKQYEQKLRAASGIPATKWANLIQIGMATRTIQESPRKQGKDRPQTIFLIPMHRQQSETLHEQITSQVKAKLFNWVMQKYDHNLRLKLTADKALPGMTGSDMVDDPALIADIEALQIRIKNLLGAIDTFYSQTWTVLHSCRTAKQMRELFPEGAKLLPEPPATNTNLAPTELAASVTEMLRKGVPPIEPAKAA
ncbi:Nmad5 family putative nucleotide modification protein [Microbulbifer sp. SAOS-129_SWC]|uniref:Nmad5 family putative nucleotide modification protein n=1 Tax=Microbulbifer sp. SAOS-129_SWC TaxID=3145235 RepID=UPI0032166FAC